MKSFYIIVLIVGFILMAATESEYGQSNLVGVIMAALSAYKLGVFDEEERPHTDHTEE